MSQNRKQQFEDLGRNLASMAAPTLSNEAKMRVRASLLKNLSTRESNVPVTSNYSWLSSLLGNAGDQIRLDPIAHTRVKERILEKLENFGVAIKPFGFSFVRLVSSTMVFTIFIGSIFFYGTVNVKAQTATRLTQVQGEVYVVREGVELPAVAGMLLLQNDVVRTESSSRATVTYYDDSVTRLYDGTEIALDQLFFDKKDRGITTNIVTSLHYGDIWVNVPGLVSDDSTFVVEAGDYMAEVVNRAAFHVKAQDESYEVGVFDSVVYVADKENNKKPVVNGFKLALQDRSSVLPLSVQEKDSEWVKGNLNQDETHLQGVKNKLIAEVQDEVKTQTEGDGLTQDIHNFEGRLGEYEVLLSNGDAGAAKDKLAELRESVQTVLSEVNALEKTDPEKAQNLRAQLNKNLALHYRILTLVSSDIDSIEGKNVLYDVKVALAPNEEAKKQLENQKAQDVLVQVADVLDEDNNVSRDQVKQYVNEAQAIVKKNDNKENDSLLTLLEDQRTIKAVSQIAETSVNGGVSIGANGSTGTSQVAEGTVAQESTGIATDVKAGTTVIQKPSANVQTQTDASNLPPQFEMNLNKDDLLK